MFFLLQGTIPGFKKASRPTSVNKVFRPPLLPANFNPIHKFSDTFSIQVSTKPRPDLKDSRHFLCSNDRAVILGEKVPKKPCESVFEIISEEDKLRMEHVKANDKLQNKAEPKLGTIEPEVPRKPSRWDSKAKASISFVGSGGASEKSAFKPFTSNPEKQERYDNFMAAKKLGKEANLQYDRYVKYESKMLFASDYSAGKCEGAFLVASWDCVIISIIMKLFSTLIPCWCGVSCLNFVRH